MITRKKLAKAAAFILVTVLVRQLLCLFLVDDIHVASRLSLQDFYDNAGKIDTLFLGSSHCRNGVDPRIADEMLGTYSFNLGTNAQTLCASYYLLREALRYDEIETVYLETFYTMFQQPGTLGDERSYLAITDFMEPESPNRYAILKQLRGGGSAGRNNFPCTPVF